MGIDMAQITNEDIVAMGDNQVSIYLPPVQVTGCYLQEPEILKWECGYIIWGGGQCDDKLNELQDVLYEEGLAELLLKAEELNIAEAAYTNAESQIYDLVSGLGYDQVYFERSTEVPPPDDSCFAAEG
jgi:hypothetical protein